jgi:hypothetical protein
MLEESDDPIGQRAVIVARREQASRIDVGMLSMFGLCT